MHLSTAETRRIAKDARELVNLAMAVYSTNIILIAENLTASNPDKTTVFLNVQLVDGLWHIIDNFDKVTVVAHQHQKIEILQDAKSLLVCRWETVPTKGLNDTM